MNINVKIPFETTLDAALAYAANGFPVLPLEGKAPMGHLVPNGFHDATTDEAIIRVWFEREPTANVGVVPPEGCAVADIDPRNGGDKTLAKLVNGYELDTLVANTGGGGQHIWFKNAPEGLPGKLGSGIDVKKAGKGYVVAPPSIHPDTGTAYTWPEGFDPARIADFPAFLHPEAPVAPRSEAQEGDSLGYSDLTESQIRAPLAKIPSDDYDDWRTVGMALKDWRDDGPGFELWFEWSQTAAEPASEADCKKKWQSFKSKGIGPGSLLHLAGMDHFPPPLAAEEFDAVDDPGPEKPKKKRTLRTRSLSDFRSRPTKWLWPGRIPDTGLVLFSGEGGKGKGQVIASIITILGNPDRPWPDRKWLDDTTARFEDKSPVRVLYFTSEDHPERTLRPRLLAAGWDDGSPRVDWPIKNPASPFNLQDDLQLLSDTVDSWRKENPDQKIVIVFDPIDSYIQSAHRTVDTHNTTMLRSLLDPMNEIAQRKDVLILAVHHFNKSKDTKAVDRVTGSAAWTQTPRLVIAAMDVPEELTVEEQDEFMLVAIKQNEGRKAPPLRYTIKGTWIEDGGEEIPISRVEFTSTDPVADKELARWVKEGPKKASSNKSEKVKRFLTDYLAEEVVPVDDVLLECAASTDASDALIRKVAPTIPGFRDGYLNGVKVWTTDPSAKLDERKADSLENWLRGRLTDGGPVSQICDEAKTLFGVSDRTVRKAAKGIGDYVLVRRGKTFYWEHDSAG